MYFRLRENSSLLFFSAWMYGGNERRSPKPIGDGDMKKFLR